MGLRSKTKSLSMLLKACKAFKKPLAYVFKILQGF